MVNRKTIEDILRGFYPTTKTLTDMIFTEMVERLDAAGVNDEDFGVLLKKYRNDPNRAEPGFAGRPPTVRQLLTYWSKTRRATQPTTGHEYIPPLPAPEWFKNVGRLYKAGDMVGACEYAANCPDCSDAHRDWAQKAADDWRSNESKSNVDWLPF